MARNGGQPAQRGNWLIAMSVPNNPAQLLDQLDSQLDTLVQLFADGRWEELPQAEAELLAILQQVQATQLARSSSNNVPRILQLKQKLDRALQLCRTRQEQLAPLIKAFDGQR